MKWTPTASLRLTTILNWVALGVVTFLMFFIPVMAKWYDDVSLAPPIFLPLCICLYLSAGLGLTALLSLARLLHNLNRNRIFVAQNVTCLRLISWCCFGVALVIPGACLVPLPGTAGGIRRRILRTDPPGAEKRVRPGGALQDEADYTI